VAQNPRRAVLFADVCDSTAIYESLGDTQALALINRLLRQLDEKVAQCSGTVVKRLGDGMVCQFSAPDAALRAACEMQTAAFDVAPGDYPKLAIKVVFTYGPVIMEGADVFGDTVNLAARLVALANPEQILTTQQTVDSLAPDLRARCRPLYPMKIRGKADEVMVCDVMWRRDAELTETLRRPGDIAGQWNLKLAYGGSMFTVEPAGSVRLGRDKANDVVVASTRASRVHARIVGRHGNFVITDQSSNGTFVLIDGSSREMVLRREEAVLGERGWIGLGASAASHGDHVLRFRLERQKSQ
jgi:adenylate cyclase